MTNIVAHAKAVDAEHNTITAFMRSIDHQIGVGAELTSISTEIMCLMDCVVNHFAHEESLMRVLNYDEYPLHKSSHDDLLVEVEYQKRKLLYGNISDVIGFIKRWLAAHDDKHDKPLAAYLQQCLNEGSSETVTI